MARSPAWSMYAKEWLSSEAVALMPPEAEGLFIRLLNLSWDNDGLPTDAEAVKDLAGRKYGRVWRTAWPPVRRKFVERAGRLVNPRQEEERDKQAERREKRIKAAETRWEMERKRNAHASTVHSPVHVQEPDPPTDPVHGSVQCLASASASAGTETASVPTVPAAPPRNPYGEVAQLLREACYQPDGQPPDGHDIAQDLRWWKYRLKVRGDDFDRLKLALAGAVLLMPDLRGAKWSPAKVFSKQGEWADLFERSITEAGKSRRAATKGPQVLATVMDRMAAKAGR